MERISVSDLRPLVKIGQEGIVIYLGPQRRSLQLKLLWLERWGGTFGPKSSAEANSKKGRTSLERYIHSKDRRDGVSEEAAEPYLDRGQRPAWILYLQCPQCLSRCRVLYSVQGQHRFGCPRCNRPAYLSNSWQPSGSRHASAFAKLERQRLRHSQAANRIRRDYLGDFGPLRGPLLARPIEVIDKPPRMTWERFKALTNLIEAHETLALVTGLGTSRELLSRVGGQPCPATDDEKLGQMAVASSQWLLKRDAWALRQRNWHSEGRYRASAGQGDTSGITVNVGQG